MNAQIGILTGLDVPPQSDCKQRKWSEVKMLNSPHFYRPKLGVEREVGREERTIPLVLIMRAEHSSCCTACFDL